MSEGLHVESKDLHNIFKDIASLIPAGSKMLNLAINVKDNKLYFYVQENVLYYAYLGDVVFPDIYQCVHFYDISPFVGKNTACDIIPDNDGITINIGQFSTYMQNSYDILDLSINDVPAVDEYDKIDRSAVYSQLKLFQKVFGAYKLYKHEFPIIIKDSMCVLKTPSIWFKGVCSLPIDILLTPDIYHILVNMMPERVKLDEGFLHIANSYAVISLPVNTTTENIDFKEVHKDYTGKSVINMYGITDIVPAFSNMPTNVIALAFSDTGLCTSINTGYTRLLYKTQNCGELKYNCELTKDILCFLLKLYSGCDTLEIYYKPGVLCFYGNNLMSIVTTI